jgi:cardiolipin synthase A/B
MLALIAAAFYTLGILAAIEAVMTTRTAQGAIAWSVSLVSFPFLALPAYLMFGRTRLAGLADRYAAHTAAAERLMPLAHERLQPWGVPSDDRISMYQAVQRLSGMSLTRGNRAELLIDGDAACASMLDGIAAAREFVLVQACAVRADEVGQRLQHALIERAQAGLYVCLLYDPTGSAGLPRRYLAALRDSGVQVSAFSGMSGLQRRLQLSFRNQRRIVVVDGAVGWVGGLDITDAGLGRSPWRDTHVRLEGPAAAQLQIVLLGDWYWATGQLPNLELAPRPASGGDVRVAILPAAPAKRLETAALLYVAAIQSARRRIWLTTSYFLPDEAVLKALELAALRGVDVRVMVPAKGGGVTARLAALHFIERLAGLGIEFYAFGPRYLHEAVTLIDDDLATIGTAHVHSRSFRLNLEVVALIADAEFATRVESMLNRDFANAEVVDPTTLTSKPFWSRLGVALARLAAPVL